MLGMVIVGQLWTFMLVKRVGEQQFHYYKSAGFNVLNIEDFKKLYIALKGVKAEIIGKVA